MGHSGILGEEDIQRGSQLLNHGAGVLVGGFVTQNFEPIRAGYIVHRTIRPRRAEVDDVGRRPSWAPRPLAYFAVHFYYMVIYLPGLKNQVLRCVVPLWGPE